MAEVEGLAEAAAPGEYTVTLSIGDRTFTKPLTFIQVDGVGSGAGFGFEDLSEAEDEETWWERSLGLVR